MSEAVSVSSDTHPSAITCRGSLPRPGLPAPFGWDFEAATAGFVGDVDGGGTCSFGSTLTSGSRGLTLSLVVRYAKSAAIPHPSEIPEQRDCPSEVTVDYDAARLHASSNEEKQESEMHVPSAAIRPQ